MEMQLLCKTQCTALEGSFYNTGPAQSCAVFVDDQPEAALLLPCTGSEKAMGTRTLVCTLAPGTHCLRLEADPGCVKITAAVPVADRYTGVWAGVKEILAKTVPPVFAGKTLSVTQFGAVGDGITDCRPAFMAGVAACASQGGGRLTVPAGTFLVCGPIQLQSDVCLHLCSKETRLLFGTDPEDYLTGAPEFGGCVPTSWEGTQIYNYSPCIYACNCENVGLTGPGTVDGQGESSWYLWRAKQKPDVQLCRRMNNEAVPLSRRLFGRGHYLRPQLVQFYGCKNVLVDGVRLVDSGFWMIHPVFCENVTVCRVQFDSHRLNNDGIDPESCRYVHIHHIGFDNGDDNIAVKSGRDRQGLENALPCRDIYVHDCAFAAYNAMAIGSEISGGVENVFIEDCVSTAPVLSALYIKTNRDRGGVTRSIHMRNLVFGSCTQGVSVVTNYKNEDTWHRTPGVENVEISDVFFAQAQEQGVHILGLADRPVQEIRLKNVFFARAGDSSAKFVRNLALDNVWANGSPLCAQQLASNEGIPEIKG